MVDIIATISLKSYAPERTREIIKAGATILRYNLSHGTPEENLEKLRLARQIIKEMNRPVRILADLPGAKIRGGGFPEKEVILEKGQELLFKTGGESPSWREFVPVKLDGFARLLTPGQVFSVGDGEMAFEVLEVLSNDAARVRAVLGGEFRHLKGMHFGPVIDTLDHCNAETLAQMDVLAEIQPELVAFSFVNSREFLQRCKSELAKRLVPGWRPDIVSKVETPLGVKNIRDIVDESQWILIARGDLGLNVPLEEFARAQKMMTAVTRAVGKRVIVSTQMLESTIDLYIPRRSDIMDLSNAIFDGAHAIMLCRETGMNDHPGRSVAIAKRLISALA